MSDPVTHLKRELLAAAERQQRHTVLAPKSRRRWLERFRFVPRRRRRLVVVLAAVALYAELQPELWVKASLCAIAVYFMLFGLLPARHS